MITIIVLLILAGVTIAMLTGENGILTNAGKSKAHNAYYTAQEQAKLAYMTVRTEIMTQTVGNSTYDATTGENTTKLGQLVEKDLDPKKEEKTWTVDYSTAGKITMTYSNDVLGKDAIAEGKPKNDHEIEYVITLGEQSASLSEDGVDLASGSEINATEENTGYDLAINSTIFDTDSDITQAGKTITGEYFTLKFSDGTYSFVQRSSGGETRVYPYDEGEDWSLGRFYSDAYRKDCPEGQFSGSLGRYSDKSSSGVLISGIFHNVVSIKPSNSTTYLELTVNGNYVSTDNDWYDLTGDTTLTRVFASNCIDVESLVTMADGSLKKLGDIEVGDEVLSVDWNTKSLVSRKVIYSGKNEEDYESWYVNCYWKNKFNDGTVIKQAMRHRFYCLEEEAFKHLYNWTPGLHTYKIDGTNPEMTSRTLVQGKIHYSRITLADDNNYFANGLLTGDSESQAGIPLTEFLPIN